MGQSCGVGRCDCFEYGGVLRLVRGEIFLPDTLLASYYLEGVVEVGRASTRRDGLDSMIHLHVLAGIVIYWIQGQ